MRPIFPALIGLALASFCGAGGARADVEYPWCASYPDGTGGLNCGFESEAQCRLSVQGTGGFCNQNSQYIAPPAAPPPAPPVAPSPAPPRARR